MMRVLVDTSAWVDFFNGFPSPAAEALAALLSGDDEPCTCGIVVAEVLQGLREEKSRRQIETLLGTMTLFEPRGLGTYVRAAAVYGGLRARGITARSTIDCIIATIADESASFVLARDRDMEAILASGMLRVGAWPSS